MIGIFTRVDASIFSDILSLECNMESALGMHLNFSPLGS
jgi:hypothetical protein